MTASSRVGYVFAATLVVSLAAAIGLGQRLASAAAPATTGRILVVDAANPQADDSGAGTEDRPFKTIAQAARIARAGDTVFVMESNYPERVELSVSGAKGKPISFVAVPTRCAFMRGFHTNGQSFIRIRGFDISNPKPFYEGRESDYEAGIQITGHETEATDNFIHDLGSAIHGIDANAVHLAYNHLYKCQQQLLINGEHWLVENNAIDRVMQYTKSDGDYCRGSGRDIILRCNRMYGTRKTVKPGEVSEVPTAHLDCFQTWASKPYHHLQGFLFEDNMCEVFSQGAMVSRNQDMDPNAISRLVFRRNIYWKGGNWGLNLARLTDVISENNTFVKIGLYGTAFRFGTTGRKTNNLYVDVHADQRKPWWDDGNKDTEFADPGFADQDHGNFRLRKDSRLIGAAVGGATVGALEYPNVYHVDGRHPGASDDGFGYAGWPYRTIGAALKAAQLGETVVVHGGVYRETLKPSCDNVTIRAAKGETVAVSGADLIYGWKRRDAAWAAPLPAEPKKVLRDGKPWTEFTYDASSKTITVKTGGDPRLHLWETVVRKQATDLAGRKDVKVEDIDVINTLSP